MSGPGEYGPWYPAIGDWVYFRRALRSRPNEFRRHGGMVIRRLDDIIEVQAANGQRRLVLLSDCAPSRRRLQNWKLKVFDGG